MPQFADLVTVGVTTGAAFSALAAVATPPATDESAGRYKLQTPQKAVHVMLGMALKDAANETCKARVYGLESIGGAYLPVLLLEATFTAGTMTGLAGHAVIDANWLLADTIVIDDDNTRNASAKLSDAAGANRFGLVTFDGMGFDYLVIDVHLNGSAAAAAPLVGFIDPA